MQLAIKRAKVTTRLSLFKKIDTSKFTRKIDVVLHLSKSAMLYQQMNNIEVAIFIQLQIDKTFLKEYLYKINILKTVVCKCKLIESILYFLFLYRR